MAVTRGLTGDWGWFDERLVRFVDDGATGVVAATLAVLVAVGVGVVHAIGPGHGKVLISAYLAGTDGRRRDAVGLGVLVAAMHTGSVLALGAVYLAVQRVPGDGTVAPVLELLVAVAVLTMGVVLLRRARTGTRHVAADDPHDHPHDDPHDHALPAGTTPLSRPGMLTLAAAGGLVPSPAAFLALVTAVALGVPWFGLALVAGFSLGLAVTLAAIGVAVVSGRQRLLRTRRASRVARWLPTVAASGVVLAGVVLLLRALLAL